MQEITFLHKYHQALIRTLGTITGRTVPHDHGFENLTDYTYGWNVLGSLAIAVWELEVFYPDAFEQHPEWEATANATFIYLVEHCSRCGTKDKSRSSLVLCRSCREQVTAEYLNSVMEGQLAQNVYAFADDLTEREVYFQD
ncbi:MAG: hypothetical protein K1Y36_11690 [Blastocatellia bacterium]|nr:hypothetical protein [Blastocatellia bacterium]